LGYLSAYPQNPFLKRPMGSIAWSYGDANWDAGGPPILNHTIPGEGVYPSPGDFVYSFFYTSQGDTLIDPTGVSEARKSYEVRTPSTQMDGVYYVDMIDSYQLWAYGALPMNGGMYVCYPNNAAGLSSRGNQEANKDFDGSGTKDMFELGMIAYFKRTSGESGTGVTQSGNKVEF
jgi:hypothetical protein